MSEIIQNNVNYINKTNINNNNNNSITKNNNVSSKPDIGGGGSSKNDASAKVAAELKSIVEVIRALVTSRKPPCRLVDILEEYKKVENRQVPYAQLGYKSVLELLRDSKSLVISRRGQDFYIEAVPNSKTSHIVSLVRGQKSSKTGGRITNTPAAARKPNQLHYRGGYNAAFSYGDRNNNYNFSKPQQLQNINYNNNKKPVEVKDLREILNARYINKPLGQQVPLKPQQQLQQKAQQLQQQQQQQQQQQKQQQEQQQQQQQQQKQLQQQQLMQQLQQPQQKQQQKSQLQQQPQQKQQQKSQLQQQNQNLKPEVGKDLRTILNDKYVNKARGQEELKTTTKQKEQQQLSTNPFLPTYPQTMSAESAKMPRPILGQNNSNVVTKQTKPNVECSEFMKYHVLQQLQTKPVLMQQPQVQRMPQIATSPILPQQPKLQLWMRQPTTQTVVQPTNPVIQTQSHSANSTVQNRLRIVATTQSNGTDVVNGLMNNLKISISNAKPTNVLQSKQDDPVFQLEKLAMERGLPEPEYRPYKNQITGTYSCGLLFDGRTCSTYPEEFDSAEDAKATVASKYIAETEMESQLKTRLPVCLDTNEQFIVKVHRELLAHPYGLVTKGMPEWFGEKFKQSLPDKWLQLMQMAPDRFLFEKGPEQIEIVSAVPLTTINSPVVSVVNVELPDIELPWQEKHWNLVITHAASTVQIWARLIGADYSDRYQQLLDDISMHMEELKIHPNEILCGHIYLINDSGIWHRVRVVKINRLDSRVFCYYLDFGDTDWLATSNLFVCEMRFQQLPAQAVSFSLFGLEDFEDYPNAHSHLIQLQGESLVAEVFTKEIEYTGCVSVVMYNTKDIEDRELNQELRDTICGSAPPPHLDDTTLENVVVTHITDAGEVYLRLVNETGWKYVQKLTQKLLESKFNADRLQVSFADMIQHQQQGNRNKLFLICDESESITAKDNASDDGSIGSTASTWYRAQLAPPPHTSFLNNMNTPTNEREKYDMFLVDIGETRRTHISCIFRLEQLSMALSTYPGQAIRMRLFNIPEITPKIVKKMKAMLPIKREAMARKQTVDTVNIYSRLEDASSGINTMHFVNEAIRVEHELSSADPLHIGSGSPNKMGVVAMSPQISSDRKSIGGSSVSSMSSGLSTPTSPISVGGEFKPFIGLTRDHLTIKKVPHSPQKGGELPFLRDYTKIPSIGEFFEVRVTMSSNPSNFTIQPYKDYPELRDLMKDLQQHCEVNKASVQGDMVERGQAYACKNPDGFYHRVIVVAKYSNEMIHVSFCDFGDIGIVTNEHLKPLPLRFRQLPKMALQAKLYGIAARNGDWSLDDCLRFRELTVGLKFASHIRKISLDTFASPPCNLYEIELIDVATEDDVYIHEVLLKEQRAIAN